MTSLLCAVAQLKAITGEDRIAWAERYHVAISACERHHRKAAFAARRRRRPCATLVTGEPPSDNLRDDGDGDHRGGGRDRPTRVPPRRCPRRRRGAVPRTRNAVLAGCLRRRYARREQRRRARLEAAKIGLELRAAGRAQRALGGVAQDLIRELRGQIAGELPIPGQVGDMLHGHLASPTSWRARVWTRSIRLPTWRR